MEYTLYPAGFPVTAPASVPKATILEAGLFNRTPCPRPICDNAGRKTADMVLNVVIPVRPYPCRLSVEFATLCAQFCRPIVVSDTQESALAVLSTDKTVLPVVGAAHVRLFSDRKLRLLKSVWPQTVRFWLRTADERLVAPQTLSVAFTVVSESVVVALVAVSVPVAIKAVADRVVAVVFASLERPVALSVETFVVPNVDVPPVAVSAPVDITEVPVICPASTRAKVVFPVTFSVDERIAAVRFVCPVTSRVPPVVIDEAVRAPVPVVPSVDVPVTPRVVGTLTAFRVAVPEEFMVPDE